MKAIRLPRSQIVTTRVGFGCAYLTGGYEARSNKDIIHAAIDLGIRHFDVAPSYGIGTAEAVLGEALLKRRDRVTIATKVGIDRPRLTKTMQAIRLFAQPIRKLAPAISRTVGTKLIAPPTARNRFSLDFVRGSIFESLKHLRTEYLDLLLLHEVTEQDLSDELLSFLEKERTAGTFLSIGIATSSENIGPILLKHAERFDVIQYSWNALDAPGVENPEHFHITHRSIFDAHRTVGALLSSDPFRAKRILDIVGYDLRDSETLSKVLLGAAIARNPNGITLAGTRASQHLIANASLLEGEQFVRAGARLNCELRATTPSENQLAKSCNS
ncbi:aldo/keto reductase [Bradyrhizobium sp. CW7]|uniref:aldo/keto reductase n=1 Tax=Bradyrhizobium sp. CW7 TaxID=2782688 RepID=UPI001FFAA2D1|nr:aldo/keto reductase [Bradyrhizobium sp. CW7]